MNIIVVVIAILLVSVLVYILLKNIYPLTEGYGSFGRVNLGKCCPRGYMFSSASKQCIAVCDGCTIESYGKLKLEFKKLPGASKKTLQSSYDCDENDSKNVYDYDKINRQYTREDLLDQDDYGEWDMNSGFFGASVPIADGSSGSEDSTAGVQGSEEGGNEAWAGISTDALTSQLSSDTIDIESDQQHYFEEIPEEHYYTSRGECSSDYSSFSSIPNKGEPPNTTGLYENGEFIDPENMDCRGYWKLDMEDQRFDYLKDGDRSIAVPSWRVYTKNNGTSKNPGYIQSFGRSTVDPLFAEYKSSNLPMVNRYISEDILNPDSPIFQYYEENFKKLKCGLPEDPAGLGEYLHDDDCEGYVTEDEPEPITETLTSNRTQFCNNLKNTYLLETPATIVDTNLELRNIPFINTNIVNSYNTLCVGNSESESSTVLEPDLVSINSESINNWDNLCRGRVSAISDENTNDLWKIPIEDSESEYINILCYNAQEDIEYICSLNDFEPDPSKTFCQ